MGWGRRRDPRTGLVAPGCLCAVTFLPGSR